MAQSVTPGAEFSRPSKTPRFDGEDDVAGKILCVHLASNKIGAASYDLPTGSFGVLNEIPDTAPQFYIVRALIKQLEPSVVVLSRRADLKLIKVVKENMTPTDSIEMAVTTEQETSATTFGKSSAMAGGDGNFSASMMTGTTTCQITASSSQESVTMTPVSETRKRAIPEAFVQKVSQNGSIVTIPGQIFVLEEAKKTVLMMNRNLHADAKSVIRIASLAGKVDIEQSTTVQALAGLLKYMEDQTIGVKPSCIEAKEPLFQLISIDDMLVVDEHSKQVMSIFKTNVRTTRGTKAVSKTEGFSLFKLLENHCPSNLGKKILRSYLNKPLRNLGVIEHRLNCIEFLMDPSSEFLVEMITKNASKIANIDLVLTRMRLSTPKPADWTTLKRAVQSAVNIARHFIDNQHMKLPVGIMEELHEIKIEELEELLSILADTIDFEATRSSEWFTVKQGVDSTLDEARERADKIEDVCAEGRLYECDYWRTRGLPAQTNLGVGFWPGIGFMMELRTSEPQFLQAVNLINDEGSASVVKSTSAAVFFQTAVTKHLNENFNDPRTFILDRQVEIQIRIQQSVAAKANLIQLLLKFCGDIQCLIALASAAKSYKWVRPVFNNEKRINIKNGRHPLTELCVLRFVPNDYSNERSIQVITGPNTSGKSVYMNQIGLIVFMAQVGCFVPADYADICPVDKIMTCSKNNDSICSGISYFMSNVNQMSGIIREATEDTLVLVDEFGKGTHPAHGTALLSAVLNYFLENHRSIPNMLVATHFHSALGFVQKHNSMQYLMFGAQDIDGDFVNQYKLIEGKAESSLAFEIALSCGMPANLVARARDFTAKLNARQLLESLPFQGERPHEKVWSEIFDEFLKINVMSKKSLDEFLAKVEERMADQVETGGEE